MSSTFITSVLAITASCITALTAIAVAVYNMFATRKNSEELERIKADLSERGKDKDARRDYEYEARKRLYKRCEPLLFQLREASDNAVHRVFSIARTSKQGNLNLDGEHWLSQNNYYLLSSIYHLIVPLAIYRLLRRELTLVDFNMDLSIRYRYELSKIAYSLFTDDFALANTKEILAYEPFTKGWQEKRESQPNIYWRQGIVVGKLEKAVESIIINKSNSDEYRWMNFGEFETAYQTDARDFKKNMEVFVNLLEKFTPKTRPILWRILISQAYIYNLILRSSGNNPLYIKEINNIKNMPSFEYNKLNWLSADNNDSEWESDFAACESYLDSKLSSVYNINITP